MSSPYADSPLRRAIIADATGVGLLGLAAATFARPLARLTGLTALQCYVAAGAFAVYFIGGTLLARHRKIRQVGIGLSGFNFVGTAGAVALIASKALPLTSTGKAVVLACGAYTLFFGIAQSIGLRQQSQRSRNSGSAP